MIYNDPAFLKTRAGLWNVLMFRGIFYGADFARNDLRRFDTPEDWQTFYQNEKSRRDPTYFVNTQAYGPWNAHRDIDLVEKYWEACHDWPQHEDLTFEGVSKYLEQT